jgi:hypothetical protein
MNSSARRVGATCSAVIMLAATAGAVEATSSPGRTPGVSVLPIFRPLLPKLVRAPVPVYLPSWLPAHPRLYSDVSFFSHTEYNYGPPVSGYRVGLYDNPRKDHASELFYMEGSGYPARSRVPIGPYVLTTSDTRPVFLGKGQWAYIYPNTEGNDGPSIFWWQKRILYHFGRQLPDQILIRVARSVVLVN